MRKKAEAAEREAKFQADVISVRRLRANMKNPASFDLETAIRMDDGTLCLSYRGTNSFNAIVPGRAVVVKGEIVTSANRERFVPLWNRRCADKTGISVGMCGTPCEPATDSAAEWRF